MQALPVVQLQGVVAQGAQLLVVLVVANADDGHLAAVDGLDQLRHASPVTSRHAVHLIHDQANLQAQVSNNCSGRAFICAIAVTHAAC